MNFYIALCILTVCLTYMASGSEGTGCEWYGNNCRSGDERSANIDSDPIMTASLRENAEESNAESRKDSPVRETYGELQKK